MDISIITPFYKGNTHMEQLFGCIHRNAKLVPTLSIELILVNDSPEFSIIYKEDWVEGFTLKIVTNPENCGIHRSRVNGLKHAQGTFVQFLDQDDLLADHTFASQFPLAQNSDVVIANGFDQNPKSYGAIYHSVAHQTQATMPHFYYAVGNLIVSPGHCLIRRDAIPAQWCDNCVSRNGSDDLLLWLMMFAQNARFCINPEKLYTHVDTGENVSANVDKMLASSFEVLDILKKTGTVTKKQAQQFLRSRRMAKSYVGKSKPQKVLAMLKYPDIALSRLALQYHKNNHSYNR